MSGKFVPGGSSRKNPSDPSSPEPIRAPSSQTPLARSAADNFARQNAARRRRRITLISIAFLVALLSLSWYYLAVVPAVHAAAQAKVELEKRTKEFEEFKSKEAERLAAEKAAKGPAKIQVDTLPSGAVVTAGNFTGKTPAEIGGITPGPIVLKIEFPGYLPVSRELNLEAGKSLDLGVINLVRKTGKMQVISSLSGVEYTLTGPDHFSRKGILNLSIDELPEGDYVLIVRYHDWTLPARTLTVKSQQATNYEVKFPYGTLQLDTVPSQAVVKSGRETVGQTPLNLKAVLPGSHSYSLELPGYQFTRIEITVGEAEEVKKVIELKKSADLTTSFGMDMVKLPEGYWAGKYEVTQSQFEKVTGSNPSFFRGLNRPIESVTWLQAVDFCRKATQMEKEAGTLPEGYQFNLPTESQWEYYLGDSNIDLAVTSREHSLRSTADVGTSEPNQYGLYDVLGNVWEWCQDPFDTAGKLHVIRGGSWLSSKENFTNYSIRNGAGDNYRDKFTGFRCVLIKASGN